ncbi:hypothetical protein Sjap_005635 [Stephania japonica]|uniref:Uncharacterized protein n=1 Tax=Stephania japonica TaxID=461633 RepID=A0AAP0PJ05_9MAGN
MAQREALGLSPLGFEPLPLYVAQPDQFRPSQPSEELSVLRILYDPGGPEVPKEVHLGSSMEESPPSEQLLSQCGLQLRRKEKGKAVKGDSSTSKEMKRLAWFVNEVPDRRDFPKSHPNKETKTDFERERERELHCIAEAEAEAVVSGEKCGGGDDDDDDEEEREREEGVLDGWGGLRASRRDRAGRERHRVQSDLPSKQ